MTDEVEVPDVKVGQRVILTGNSWKALNWHGHEVDIAGFEHPGGEGYDVLPYFEDPDQAHIYVYSRAGVDYEDYSAEVVPMDTDEQDWPFKPGDTVRRIKFTAAYTIGGEPFQVVAVRDSDGAVTDPYGQIHHLENLEAVEISTPDTEPNEQWKLEIPGVGVGYATSQEDYNAMLEFAHQFEEDPIENAFQMRDWDEYERLVTEEQERALSDYSAAVDPGHYKFPGGAEVIDITRHLGFLEGNVVKYVTRARRKTESGLEDLLKARKYLDWAIEDAEAELG
jgi:hypothetical protein